MSIKQYFKTKVPNEDIDIESSDFDSDLEETHVELPNINRDIAQKNLNFKKKKAYFLAKKKTGTFHKECYYLLGLKNFKSSTLGEHALTKDHTDATNHEIGKAELIKVTNNAINKAQQYIDALMKVVFWLAENDILLNKLSKVIQLCRAFECPKLLSNSNPVTYENHISGRQMLSAISNSIEETIWKELDKATAFGNWYND
ncbi:hypothetical protein C1645_742695 [Glomus cerebriforme]|uniref:Uncharacterized protein n=1 Tax=Glomus cerebriforme TaxID=658196 RepID=A0A397SDA5_9GLOM|nr:hypothetical protein C1645_742695 [Glomus cerebriforme]